jgi:hypothetical protein
MPLDKHSYCCSKHAAARQQAEAAGKHFSLLEVESAEERACVHDIDAIVSVALAAASHVHPLGVLGA